MVPTYDENSTMKMLRHHGVYAEEHRQIEDIVSAHGYHGSGDAYHLAHDAYVAGIIAGKRIERARRNK